MKSTNSVRACLLALIVLTGGCSAAGPAFQPAEELTQDSDNGLVYVYREPSFVGSGVYYTVRANGEPVTTLKNGGYYPYYAPAGEIKFEAKTESTATVTVQLRPGETRYVRGSVGIGLLVGRPKLVEVGATTGAAEIKECKLLEKATE